jgi:preprotein translocase subunit SecG
LQTFQPGLLQAFAVAEEKAFSAKTNALFLSLFVIWVAVLMFFQLQAYLDRTGN